MAHDIKNLLLGLLLGEDALKVRVVVKVALCFYLILIEILRKI